MIINTSSSVYHYTLVNTFNLFLDSSWGYTQCRYDLEYANFGVLKGENHFQLKGWPKVAFRLSQYPFFWWEASCLRLSMPVSSEQIADTWVPHIMAVKIPKRRASKIRNMRKTVVAGGDTPEQVFHSLPTQVMKWWMDMYRAWNDIIHIYIVNKTKNFWLLSPTQLLTHGQWWSIFLMHLWQTLQWWALSGFMETHLGHLNTTCPSAKFNRLIFSWVAFPFGTAPGSVSIHRTCEATAMKAKNWKMTPLTTLHVVLGLWISITKFTTYTAYRTSSHVKMAHTHPQMSLTHHKLGSVISQARPSFRHKGPRSTVVTPSSTGPLCRDFSVLTIGPFGSSLSLCLFRCSSSSIITLYLTRPVTVCV